MLARLRDLRRFLSPLLAGAFALGLLAGAVEAAEAGVHEGPVRDVAVAEASQPPAHADRHAAHPTGDHDRHTAHPTDPTVDHDPHPADHHDHHPTDPADHHAAHGCDSCTCFAVTGGCSVPLLGSGVNVPVPLQPMTRVGVWQASHTGARSTFEIFRPPRL